MSISEFIFSWLKDIVLLFIIITLVDLVMPKGNMGRYINFVVGLLIIFTVINPFISLANINFQLDREVFRNIDNIYEYDEGVIKSQNDQIESLYKNKVSEEIRNYVENNSVYKILSLEVEVNNREDNFGAISYLNILIDDDNGVDESNIDIKVKQVTLKYNTRVEISTDYLDIKNLISNRYEIDKDLINISTTKLED